METENSVVIPTQTVRKKSSKFSCIICKKLYQHDVARFVLAFNKNDVKINVNKAFMCTQCSKKQTPDFTDIPISEDAIDLICSMVRHMIGLHGITVKKVSETDEMAFKPSIYFDPYEPELSFDPNEILDFDIYETLFETCITKLLPVLKSYNPLMLKRTMRLYSRCNYCQKEDPIYRCSGCDRVYYCNETCSKNDWRKHKASCFLIKIIADDAVVINL